MEFFKFIVKDLHPHSKTNFQFGEKEDVTTEIESCDYLPLCQSNMENFTGTDDLLVLDRNTQGHRTYKDV